MSRTNIRADNVSNAEAFQLLVNCHAQGFIGNSTGSVRTGNSTVNSVVNSTAVVIANSTLTLQLGPADFSVGANSALEATRVFQGNSTVNAVLTQTSLAVQNSTLSIVVGPTTLAVGANSVVEAARMFVGNSTVNSVQNSTSFKVSNSTANATMTMPTTTEYSANDRFMSPSGSWLQPQGIKSISVLTPNTAENIAWFYAPRALVVSEIRSVVKGSSPSVTFTIRYGTDRSGSGTEVVTGGTTVTNVTSGLSTTSFDSATISAGSFVQFRTTATSGTVDEVHVTMLF
jgi:hypothetical protein